MILVKHRRSNTIRKYVYLLSIMLGLPLTGLLILGMIRIWGEVVEMMICMTEIFE